MALRKDIAQTTTGDLKIQDGDFVISASDAMHVQDTIIAHPGWWKEFPQDGVGVSNYDRATGAEQELARKIKLELENDGYTVSNPQVSFDNDKLTIAPNATRV